MERVHRIRTTTILLAALPLVCILIGCGGGGKGSAEDPTSGPAYSNGALSGSEGGGEETSRLQEEGDAFRLQEIFFGRPIMDGDGKISQIVNPASLIETDPLTGDLVEGFPKTLDSEDSLDRLYPFKISGDSLQVPIVPRNAVLLLRFSRQPDSASLCLDENSLLTEESPVRVSNDKGGVIPLQAFLDGDSIILNPVLGDGVGFPPSPCLVDQGWDMKGSSEGYLKIRFHSALRSVAGTALTFVPEPIGFNPGNRFLNFISHKGDKFNGFLPDLSVPRIMRTVKTHGKAGPGSDPFTLVDRDKNFVTAANSGNGEWAGASLVLRPGEANEERGTVKFNTANSLHMEAMFVDPPEPGKDRYRLRRAEFFEPIPGLIDLSTAVDPLGHPKDPFDPEDANNWDLIHFAHFDAWNPSSQEWEPVDYDPGPMGLQPIDPNWRISFRFSQPMALDSMRPYETFYVCDASLNLDDPAFDAMKPGQVTARLGNTLISFEPALFDRSDYGNPHVIGFGGEPKTLRLVLRVIPPDPWLDDFYDSLGPPSTWPPEIVEDLHKKGVLGIAGMAGQPLGLPAAFLDLGSPHCITLPNSAGRGAFPPAVDLKLPFNTKGTFDPESGSIVHRFMGLPHTGAAWEPPWITGIIFNDHEGLIYGPHIADGSIGLNGFLSGHPVEFIEHVFDDNNQPSPASPYYPDLIQKMPFGVGTPINCADGCRFQHIYRNGEASPDVLAFEGTLLDLYGLAWAPIGDHVTNTLIEKMSIGLSYSEIVPNTGQHAGIPDDAGSGLRQLFSKNFNGHEQVVTVGEEDDGVPYYIDAGNLFKPKNAGAKFNYYLPWPEFDKPLGRPGLPYDSSRSLLIEYRFDPNVNGPVSQINGFSFHAAILTSMLPRFRIFTRGDETGPIGPVYGATNPDDYTQAQGPLAAPGNYGDNARYFMIFNYVKRESLIESPFLGFDPGLGKDLVFLKPVVDPPLTEVPQGTELDLSFQAVMDPLAFDSHKTPWVSLPDVEQFNTHPIFRNYNYIRFRAVFKANVEEGSLPVLDTVSFPFEVIQKGL